MSSSMRNVLQRRNHKERSQPAARAKWGLLEKCKDYQLRSQDYKKKKLATSQLRAVARDRNPDEYRPAMTRAHTRDGGIRVAKRPESVVLSNDQTLLLKTQDAGYFRTQAQIERKQIEALEARLAFVGEECGTHKVFLDDGGRAVLGEDDEGAIEALFNTPKELLRRKWSRPTVEQVRETVDKDEDDGKEAAKVKKRMAKERRNGYKELEARMRREKDLRKLERELDLQRARMGKGNTTTKNKWAKVRKR